MAGEIKKTIVIDARPQAVFRAITDEKELTNWFPDQAKFEARVGGFVQFRFYQNGKEHQSGRQSTGDDTQQENIIFVV